MKLVSVICQVPSKHLEWCFLERRDRMPRSFNGIICGSFDIATIPRHKDFPLKSLRTGDTSYELLGKNYELVKELEMLEEFIPGLSYLVFVNMEYEHHSGQLPNAPYYESFRSLDSVLEFLKSNGIRCIRG